MALESLSGGLDPLLWAKKPRSQTALDFVRRGASGRRAATLCFPELLNIAEGRDAF